MVSWWFKPVSRCVSHETDTTLHLVTTPHLFQMPYHNALAVMSPVFSGDVDALTAGRLLTLSLTCAGWHRRVSWHQAPHTRHTGLVTGHSHPHPETQGGQWSVHPTAVSCLVGRGWLGDTGGIWGLTDDWWSLQVGVIFVNYLFYICGSG